MPIYEFVCLECKKDSELLVRSSNWKGDASCPSCGSKALDKKLSVFSPSSGDQSMSVGEIPPCSGMPSDCGRCDLGN